MKTFLFAMLALCFLAADADACKLGQRIKDRRQQRRGDDQAQVQVDVKARPAKTSVGVQVDTGACASGSCGTTQGRFRFRR